MKMSPHDLGILSARSICSENKSTCISVISQTTSWGKRKSGVWLRLLHVLTLYLVPMTLESNAETHRKCKISSIVNIRIRQNNLQLELLIYRTNSTIYLVNNNI